MAVDGHDAVAIHKAQCLSLLVEDIAVYHIVVVEVGLTPGVCHSGVDADGEECVHNHTRNHHQQSLPRILATQLILRRLQGALLLLRTLNLCLESRYLGTKTLRLLGVATTQCLLTLLCQLIALLGCCGLLRHKSLAAVVERHITAQWQPADAILRVTYLTLEERKPGVEEDVELVDTCANHTRGDVVSELVYQDKHRQRCEEL